MPGMTGFDVCEKLRSNAALADMKIIILSAFGQAEDVNRAELLGAERFMTKPFSPRALKELLHELLL
jgi:CheY-like chemotaxis protein